MRAHDALVQAEVAIKIVKNKPSFHKQARGWSRAPRAHAAQAQTEIALLKSLNMLDPSGARHTGAARMPGRAAPLTSHSAVPEPL